MQDRTIQAGALLAFVAIGALCPISLHAQEVPITNGGSVLGWPISVRLVNGENGKPITDEKLNVFINNATDSQLFRPDERGIIKLTVTITTFYRSLQTFKSLAIPTVEINIHLGNM